MRMWASPNVTRTVEVNTLFVHLLQISEQQGELSGLKDDRDKLKEETARMDEASMRKVQVLCHCSQGRKAQHREPIRELWTDLFE